MVSLLSHIFSKPKNLSHLSHDLNDFRKRDRLPSKSFWPKSLYFPKEISQKIQKMRSWTKEDGFEYEISLFVVSGDFVSSPLFRGERTKVHARHSIRVDYEQKSSNKLRKIVTIDDTVVLRKDIFQRQYDSTKNIHTFASIHTHPAHEIESHEGKKSTYGFFSPQDIRSLLHSKNSLIGLITDRIWLACKTDQMIQNLGENGERMLQTISHSSYKGVEDIHQQIRNHMRNWGIVFYTGGFHEYLRRIK